MRAIILIYAQVQFVYFSVCVSVCVRVSVCACQALFAAGKININCKNCQSQRQKKNKKGMQWKKTFKVEKQFQYTYLLGFFTDQHIHTHTRTQFVYACVCFVHNKEIFIAAAFDIWSMCCKIYCCPSFACSKSRLDAEKKTNESIK